MEHMGDHIKVPSQSQLLSRRNQALTPLRCTTGAISTFDKSKEDFHWWVKMAMADKKSYSYSELYHSLLKMFADLLKMAEAYGFAPKTVQDREGQ